jgi:hypothetical protein
MLAGELLFIATAVGLAYVNWRATLVVFFIPVVAVRFLMMAGNWGQHAFVAADAPESAFKNSITCLAARYNRRCFNDGYHIGHHVKGTSRRLLKLKVAVPSPPIGRSGSLWKETADGKECQEEAGEPRVQCADGPADAAGCGDVRRAA